jgi:hypothetical protein
MSTLEQLVALRASMYTTITNLQMGLLAEKKKADEFEFFRNDKNFDKAAMDSQAARSLENVKSIQKVLDEENIRLSELDKQIQNLTGVITAHGTHPCLIGAIPHTWQVLARHNSGQFSHRKCVICNADEKVGYA